MAMIAIGLVAATTGIVKAEEAPKQHAPIVYAKHCQPLFNHAFALRKKHNRAAYTAAKRQANACLVEDKSGVKKKHVMEIHQGNDEDIRTNDELFHADRYTH